MEHYIVSARKYRPSTFNTVVGQKPLTAALKHAVATDKLAHAYLFCGSRGVGKTSCARIFAKTINCTNRTADGEACNECESCRSFNNNTSLNIIELDAASHNGVDDIRALNEQVLVPPTMGRYRVFIIDEVHMLSSAAFNAFLKTLEEPPEYVIFILATTEKHKIIPTILSRCQIYDFNRITIQDMVDHLAMVARNEGINAEPAALNVIARKADGAMRDALSIFDQVAASSQGDVSYAKTIENLNILDSTYYSRLVSAFLTGDVPQALLIYQEVRENGFDSQFFVNGLAQYMRDLMVAQNPATISLLEAADDEREQMASIAAQCHPTFLYKAMDLCNDADLNFRVATNKQFLVELTLIKMCQIVRPAQSVPQNTLAPVAAPQQTAQPAPQPRTDQRPPQHTPAQQQPQQMPQQQQQPPRQYPQQQYQAPPRQTPSAAPAMQPRKVGGMPSLSIKGRQAAAQTDAADTDTEDPHHRRNMPYDAETLKTKWMEYADLHPTERILVNTMKASLPEPIDNNRFKVTVDDTIQVDALVEAKPDILAFLHDSLQNDNVDFTAEIRSGAPSPQTWTQREVLAHMIEKNSELKSMIDDFSLSL